MNVEVNHPNLSVNFGAERVYPELEDLEVTPTNEEQNFKSSKYGFNNVKVKAIDTKAIGFPLELDLKNVGGIVEMVLSGNNIFLLKDDKTAIISVVEENKINIEEKEISYLELEYIEFTGTQYFDTLFPLWSYNSWKVEMEIMLTKLYDYSHVLSTSDSDTYNEIWINKYGNYDVRLNNSKVTVGKVVANEHLKIIHEYNSGVCDSNINDELINSKNFGNVNVSNNLRFGKRNSSYFIGKLYSMKFYANDILVRDFVPAKDLNGVICLYDKVSATFFYNAGTGDFATE